MNKQKEIKVSINNPQLKYRLLMPRVAACIWGRMTGKTSGPGAEFILNNVLQMPRSLGLIVGATFEHMEENTLPPIFAAFARQGWIEGKHFWIGRYGPEEVPRPLQMPIKTDHVIHFRNGSTLLLVSMRKRGTSVGSSAHYVLADEVRFLNKKRFDSDIVPAIRGDYNHFGHLSSYQSFLYLTDMPKRGEADWIFDFEKKHDERLVKYIISLSIRHEEFKRKYLQEENPSEYMRNKYRKQLKLLNEARKLCTYYSTASSIENIGIVGAETILNVAKELSISEIQRSLKNDKNYKQDDNYYPKLSKENKYESIPSAYGYLGDLDTIEDTLFVGCDHNSEINTICVGQLQGNEFRIVNTLDVEFPHTLEDLAEVFSVYYKDMKQRNVVYFFDHTSVNKRADTLEDFKDKITRKLEANKFIVEQVYLGQAMQHQYRIDYIGDILDQKDKSLPKLLINTAKCSDLITSLENTNKTITRGFVTKDKSSEKNKKIKPQHATHYGEAFDVLVTGFYKWLYYQNFDFSTDVDF